MPLFNHYPASFFHWLHWPTTYTTTSNSSYVIHIPNTFPPSKILGQSHFIFVARLESGKASPQPNPDLPYLTLPDLPHLYLNLLTLDYYFGPSFRTSLPSPRPFLQSATVHCLHSALRFLIFHILTELVTTTKIAITQLLRTSSLTCKREQSVKARPSTSKKPLIVQA